MNTMRYTVDRELPVYAEPEVLVVGGGTAGMAAAWSAASQGRNVMLTERLFCLGGTGTSGLVGPFMTSTDPEGKEQLITGFYRKLMDRLIAAGGALEPMDLPNCDAHSSWHMYGHRNVGPFNPETLKFVSEEMCLEQGVQILYGVQAVDVIRDSSGKKIESVIFAAKEGFISVRPKVVIDCTGDADVAELAGCPMMKGEEGTGEMQAAGLFFSIDGIDEAKLQSRYEAMGWESMRFTDKINIAVEDGEYPIPRRRLGLYKANDDTWRGNITRIPDVDATKSADLTHIAIEGRKQISAIIKFLKKHVDGCQNVRLLATAAMPGIRESRRIKGDFVMSSDDVYNGTIFEDAILWLSNSIDVHTGLTGVYTPSKKSYTLPYRILLPSGVDNLLAAGRNISCDRNVLAAIRVMPPCFGMGEAAGNAASLAVEDNCSCAAVDVKKLQKRLIDSGVRLPAAK